MPRRVGVHPERPLAVLRVERGGAEREHPLLGGVHVLDHHVDVELLRVLGGRPLRRYVTGGGLERELRAVGPLEVHPPVAVVLDRPADELGVEAGEGDGIGTVQYDGSDLADAHASSSVVTAT
jgi:hypothetical protein